MGGNDSREAERKARQAEALRANLKRRREQARCRAVPGAGVRPQVDVSDDAAAVNPPQTPLKHRD